MAQKLRHPLTLWLIILAVVLSGAGFWNSQSHPNMPAISAPPRTVEVPIRPSAQPLDANPERVTVTARWGHPAGSRAPSAAVQNPATPQDSAAKDELVDWDGYLALDCGQIEHAEPLDLEAETADGAGDRLGPIVRGELGDQRVYWRSRTARDWDGLQVRLATCSSDAAAAGGTGSKLRIVTKRKTYVARLDWSLDDFVSLNVGEDGSTLDVHISAVRDPQRLQGARITQAQPVDAGAKTAPIAQVAPESPVVGITVH